MKPIWKGAISFGLVNIPVQLLSAEERTELNFNMIDQRDHARIKYQRINAETGKEVPWENIVKMYEFEDGSYVVVTDEDFEKADPKASKTIEIEQFIEAKELNPMYLEKPYYVAPVKGGEKPYSLLRDAMKESGKVAIGRVTIRTKQSMGAILPVGDALVLNLLRYSDEIRTTETLNLPESEKITDKEMDLAISLIDGLTASWNPEEFQDEYTSALMKRIEAKAKLKGKDLPEEPEEEEVTPSKVVDIMDLLKKSIETKSRKRSDPADKAAPGDKSKTSKSSGKSDEKAAPRKRKSS